MSLGFISSRRRLTTTASLQMGDGERGYVAGNQDDPRPSPPNGTDRASPRASVHSQAHWGLEMELRRPGALAARLLRVVSGSPAAARVLGEEQKSPQFRIPSHRIARVPPRRLVVEISKRGRRPSLCLFLATLTCPRPGSNRLIISSSPCLHTATAPTPFSKSSHPACGSWG